MNLDEGIYGRIGVLRRPLMNLLAAKVSRRPSRTCWQQTCECRDYFACPQDRSMQCKYFQWADEVGKEGAKQFQPSLQGGPTGAFLGGTLHHLLRLLIQLCNPDLISGIAPPIYHTTKACPPSCRTISLVQSKLHTQCW